MRSKLMLEDMVENACTCGGGTSFYRDDHEPGCKAHEVLEQHGLTDTSEKYEWAAPAVLKRNIYTVIAVIIVCGGIVLVLNVLSKCHGG